MSAEESARSYSEQVVPGLAYTYEGSQVASERSEFQRIDIFESEAFGRVLMLDGLLQTTERDEFLYHEMLVHVPLIAHPDPRRVLVIGGGDGGTLRRVLEHPSVERALMIEIDERVTALCREHMPSVSAGALDDARADVRFIDGIAYVRDADERFDVILIDSSDPVGPGEALFTTDFYAAASRRLNDGGVLVAQSGSPFFQQDELHRAYTHVGQAFGSASVYLGQVPTYPGSLWTFTMGGTHDPLTVEEARRRAAARGLATRYWSPELQAAAFTLPRLVVDILSGGRAPRTFGASIEERARGR